MIILKAGLSSYEVLLQPSSVYGFWKSDLVHQGSMDGKGN